MAVYKPGSRGPTRKQKRAANKKAYKEAKATAGAGYAPKGAKRDPKRKRPKLPAKFVPPQGRHRARGPRTDEDVVKEVLELVSAGMTLQKALKSVGLSVSQFWGWKDEDRFDLQKRYKAARIAQSHAFYDDIIEEANKARHGNFQGHKLRIDTKKWAMGRTNPADYGDKVTNIIEGGINPLQSITETRDAKDAAAAFAEELKAMRGKRG